jgi:hypothetical protein
MNDHELAEFMGVTIIITIATLISYGITFLLQFFKFLSGEKICIQMT